MNILADKAIFQSKKHFHTLDGLRGVAALAVLVFHFMEWVYPDISQNFIGHGFLAVDFFFCLSGFVVAYAYDSRFQEIGMKSFFISRLIRLHPLVVAGSVIGLLGLLFDPFSNQIESLSAGKLFLIFIASLLLIPLPIMEERAYNLFSLNAPSWSLFWEYIANILYALVLVRLPKKILWVLLLLSAGGILWVSHCAGNLLGGWSGPTFADGGIRMGYSFLAGLLVYRSGWILKNKLGFLILAVLLSSAFMMPWLKENWLAEALVVLIYFPLLVALGAGTVLSSGMEGLCSFLGNISYPLYMTHYAFIWWFGNYYLEKKPSGSHLVWIVVLGTLGMVLFAWLVMKFYDKPLRKFLNKHRIA